MHLNLIVYFLKVINHLPTETATGCQIQKLDIAKYVNNVQLFLGFPKFSCQIPKMLTRSNTKRNNTH